MEPLRFWNREGGTLAASRGSSESVGDILMGREGEACLVLTPLVTESAVLLGLACDGGLVEDEGRFGKGLLGVLGHGGGSCIYGRLLDLSRQSRM